MLKLFLKERDSFFSWGEDSGWVANSLSHCCQLRVLELSNIHLQKEKMQNKGIEKKDVYCTWGELRNAYKILVDILEPRAERTWVMWVHFFIFHLSSDAVSLILYDIIG